MRNPRATQLLFELSKPGRRAARMPVCDVPEKPVAELLPAKAIADWPLTDEELRAFVKPFSGVRTRAFCLPHVLLGAHLPWVRQRQRELYGLDAAALRRFPSLAYYAGIRVVEVTKG